MKRMQFGFLGIDYKRAGLEIRSQISFTDTQKINLFQKAECSGVEQCMVLSTCNRSEIYFFYENEDEWEQMRQRYQEMFPDVKVEEYLLMLQGSQAMEHLFRVSAGLESLVLGEDQILGQVKEALDFSRTMGHASKEMNKLVRDAITCAKKIKTNYKISEIPLSVSYIGVRRLNELCGIGGKKILVVGSGKAAVLALKYIYEYAAEERTSIVVCSRTASHAKRLHQEFPGIQSIAYEERYEVMTECDIVVSATASPHLVIVHEKFEVKKPITFLDLASPRDVDAAFEREPLCQLINLDTLQQISEENYEERKALIEKSRDFIQEQLQATQEWLLQSRLDETIESLQNRCLGIETDSFEYLNQKMDLSVREQKLLKKVLHASLQRMVREPIQELRQLQTREEQDEYREMMKRLFRF